MSGAFAHLFEQEEERVADQQKPLAGTADLDAPLWKQATEIVAALGKRPLLSMAVSTLLLGRHTYASPWMTGTDEGIPVALVRMAVAFEARDLGKPWKPRVSAFALGKVWPAADSSDRWQGVVHRPDGNVAFNLRGPTQQDVMEAIDKHLRDFDDPAVMVLDEWPPMVEGER